MRAVPVFSVASPFQNTGTPGQTLTYRVNIATNDNSTSCSNWTFQLVVNLPGAGWSYQSAVPDTFQMGPRNSLGFDVNITSPVSDTFGYASANYPIQFRLIGDQISYNQAITVSYVLILPTPTPVPTPTSTPTVNPTPTPTAAPNASPIFVTGRILPAGRIYRAYRVNVVGYDVNAGDTLTMKISNLPRGLTQGTCATYLESGRRYISCPISGNASQIGLFGIRATLTDNRGGVAVKDFLLTIFP